MVTQPNPQIQSTAPTWIEDANGNKCSVEYFGSIEAAQAALDSLKNCSRCTGCSDVAYLYDKNDIRAVVVDGEAGAPLGQPPIPVIENIHQHVYAAASQPQALNMGDWHTCNTTHCRGGWVVHLAGEAGYALERFHNTALAAQLIYDASDPSQNFNPCRFYDSGETALADMKRLADLEASKAVS